MFATGIGPGAGWQQSCNGANAGARNQSESGGEGDGSIRDACSSEAGEDTTRNRETGSAAVAECET